MTRQEAAWEAAEAAAEALAPEADQFASVDLAGFGESLAQRADARGEAAG